MTESQELDVIAGSVEKIDQDGRPFGLAHSAALGEISFEQMLSRNLILAPTAMIRKSVFERFGVYDPRFVLEDYYMWLKVLNGGGVIRIFDKIWAFYRVTGGNSIAKLRWYLKGATQVLSIYKNHPLAELHLNKMTFRYLVKVALLDGKSSMTESAEIPTRPSKVQRVLLHSISVLPQRLRLMIYERIGG